MGYDKTPLQRQAQLETKFQKDTDTYQQLHAAVDKSMNSAWKNNIAACIKFGSLNFISSGKVGGDTYRAFEGKAKLLIAILRTLQAAKNEKSPQSGNAETIDKGILSKLGVFQQVPPLPVGGDAKNLSAWLSQLGLKKGDEKKDPRTDPLTKIVENVNANINKYLKQNADNFPTPLKGAFSEYITQKQLDEQGSKINRLEETFMRFKKKFKTRLDELEKDLDKHRSELDVSVRNNSMRIGAVESSVSGMRTNFEMLNDKIDSMKAKITKLFDDQIADVRQQYLSLQTKQAAFQNYSTTQVDEMHRNVKVDLAVLYADVYALQITQRLHLDLTYMLAIASNVCCRIGCAVGTGFDQYAIYAKKEESSKLNDILLKGIGYVCKKIPIVGGAYELIEDGAEAIGKICGPGDPTAEEQYDPLNKGELEEPTAADKGAIAKLKAWAAKCKKNKELQGTFIPVGLQALRGVSRQSLGVTMRDALSRQTEEVLAAYSTRIEALLDTGWVRYELKQRNLDSSNLQAEGKRFVENIVVDFSPLEYNEQGKCHCNFSDVFSEDWIISITELYLYGSVREPHNKNPAGDWNNILNRFGFKNIGEGFNLFVKRFPDDKEGDKLMLTSHRGLIPLPQGVFDDKDKRKVVLHVVLVALKKKIDQMGWGQVFRFEPNEKVAIRQLLKDRVAVALDHRARMNYSDKQLTKGTVIDEYIDHVLNTSPGF